MISVPLSFFGGIGGASRCGILVKGSCYLETLARCDTVVLDKTGTLTEGKFSVVEVNPVGGLSAEELLILAASGEQHSSHPIARALTEATPTLREVTSVTEVAGFGVRAEVTDGKQSRRISVGSHRLMDTDGVGYAPCEGIGTAVYVAVDGEFAGSILVADTLKAAAPEAISALRRLGVRRTVMLTGDNPETAAAVAAEVGVDDYRASLLPADKVEAVEELLASPNRRGKVAFVGDGINDAPVLARADVGVAMGGLGSDAAIEAADVVLMDDRVEDLPRAVRIARRTLRIVRQNIVFALGVKAVILILGALGVTGMWAAVFADVGVAVIAILNAMRALEVRKI